MVRTLLRAALVGTALSLAVPAFAQEPLKVVASFSILGDMVSQIGGSDVSVEMLVGPGGDAHVFEPSPGDAGALKEADLLVVNGLGFETWLPDLLRMSGFEGRIVTASDGVAPREPESEEEQATAEPASEEDRGPVDPHAWQELRNGVIYARNITAALAEVAPTNAVAIRARGRSYADRLAGLDDEIRMRLSAIPEERRRIVTPHDAFGYFGAAYGITFIAPGGVSTKAAASDADVARVVDRIRHDKITAVFVEPMTDGRITERIAAQTGVHVAGTLYSDSLSPPSERAATYEAMFRYNADQIVSALHQP